MIWRLIPEEFGLPLLIRTLNERFRGGVGAARVSRLSTSGALSVSAALSVVLVDTAAGSVTLTLPLARTVPGFVVQVKKMTAANTLTVEPAGSDLIDDDPSVAWTTQYTSWTFTSSETGWVLT